MWSPLLTVRSSQIVFKSTNPYDPLSWSDATHFSFFGYDTSPYWAEDGTSYIVGSHYWKILPGLQLASVDLDTGEVLSDVRAFPTLEPF